MLAEILGKSKRFVESNFVRGNARLFFQYESGLNENCLLCDDNHKTENLQSKDMHLPK